MPPIRTSGSHESARRLPWRYYMLFCVMTLPQFGCAQLKPTHSGYLTDYSNLQAKSSKTPIIRSRVVESAISGTTPLAGIDSFMIEPVAWLAKESTPSLVVEDCQKNLSAKLQKALSEELNGLKPVVDVPGPRTARVRAAVTQVAFARPLANSALSVVAVPLFNGGGTVEAEVIGPDGKQIAVVVAALPGRPWEVLGFFTWQGHAESAMRRSAAELRRHLSQPPPDATTPETPDISASAVSAAP